MAEFQRSGYRIKLNHSNALPRYILSLAVESRNEEVNVSGKRIAKHFRSASVASCRFASGAFISQTSNVYNSKNDLWAAIYNSTASNYTTWLVGHNVLPALILCGLPHRFQSGEITIDKPRSKRTREDNDDENTHQAGLAVIESPPTIIGCRVGSTQGRIVIVDLLNWFPGSIPTDNSATGIANTEDSTVEHCGNSQLPICSQQAVRVLQVFKGLISWVKDNEMGQFRYTASAQAFGAYRHRFMEHQIYVHDNNDVQKQERKAYYGGRSEAFKLGPFEHDVYQLDVSALFPSVMACGNFPYRLSRSEQREKLIAQFPLIDWSRSLAEVEIITDKPRYPYRSDVNIVYPTGRFTTSLCGYELYSAWRAGHISRLGSWSEYEVAPLFGKWVSDLWAMRQSYRASGNLLYAEFTKKIMNSLYGKFAQLTPGWVNAENDWSMLPWTTESRRDNRTGNWDKYRSIGWQIQKQQERTERPQSFYAISAFITSAARYWMDYLRHIAGKQYVYYQGVDSLIVCRQGYDNLIAAGEVEENTLGKLRLIYQSDYGYIRGISDYQIGEKVVLSSRALNSEMSDQGDIIQHKYYVMEHLFKDGPIDYIEESLEPWQRRQGYTKGIVGQDGWVSPFELGGCPTSAKTGVGSADAATAANCSNSGL